MKGYIHSIETFGSVDGPGIRYVVFMQGCPLRCIYCHNPDSWNIKDGKVVSVNEVVKDILKYKHFIESGGVTISGGEPLVQYKFVEKLIKKLKKHNIEVAIDTSGAIPVGLAKKAIDACDLVMLDIKSLDDDLHKTITGMSNKKTLEMLEYCEKISKPVWIRHVILPGYTLDFDSLEKLAKFLTKYKTIEMVDLLSFHKFGEYKWENLGYDYKLKDTTPPSKEDIEKVRQIFKKNNLPIMQ